jgi:hypothetical protein
MKPKFKEIIHSYLKEAQEKYGGYTGNDIAMISRKINRQPGTLRRQIEKLRGEDAAFSNFTYIGKRYTDLTLDEILFLQYKLQDNCIMLKSLLLEELNKRRIEEGKSQIPLSTFYKFLGNLMNNMEIYENDEDQIVSTDAISTSLSNIGREYVGLPGPDLYFCSISPTSMLSTTTSTKLQMWSSGMRSLKVGGNSQDCPILSLRITLPYKHLVFITKE